MSTPTTPGPGHFGGPVPGPGEHPAWCSRMTVDGPCDVAGYHATGYIAAEADDRSALVEADLFGSLNPQTGQWGIEIMLRLTEEDTTENYAISLDQAEAIAALLTDLVGRVRSAEATRAAAEYAATDDNHIYDVVTAKGTRLVARGINSARVLAGKDGTYQRRNGGA